MLHYLAPILTEFWGPFRLLGSYVVLIGLGTAGSALTTWLFLPKLWQLLPQDRGRSYAVNADQAQGKPTGAGLLIVLLALPWLFLVIPFRAELWEAIGCLIACMLTGYLDDRSRTAWGEWLKGSLDLAVAAVTSLVLCQGTAATLWLPLWKGEFMVSPWLYVAISTVLLWLTINATNCSDGVDGLAGTLVLLSLFYLGGFLYVVIGHIEVAGYLLVPHNARGAAWAVLLLSSAGSLAGYLWYNAKPSAVLMGDAGSRYLGLLVGIAVMVAGNPLLILVAAPVMLANGVTGLVKVVLLRVLKRVGFDIRHPDTVAAAGGQSPPHPIVAILHSVRFPLHDHCRHRLHWSDPQVILRFVLIQAFLTPLLFVLLVKLR